VLGDVDVANKGAVSARAVAAWRAGHGVWVGCAMSSLIAAPQTLVAAAWDVAGIGSAVFGG
jgi:hypothetical protein